MKTKLFLYINLLVALFLFAPHVAAGGKTFTVVIDPGHGGSDPGAIGASSKEKEINLAVALKVGNLISANHKDVKVVYTRSTDRFIGLDDRAFIANKNKADLFISIHTNAVKNAAVRGAETFTMGLARTDENLQVAMRENAAILLEDDYMQKYEGFDPKSSESYIIFEFMQNKHIEQSISLASEIQKGFVACKRSDRGVRQAGFLVLRKTSMPSVLVELGFISNKEEERYMKSAEGQNNLAKAISNAFTGYKREYDRKQGRQVAAPVAATAKETAPKSLGSTQTATAATATKGVVVYKVQILASNKKLGVKAKELKGYSSENYYTENGMYKYTHGETTSLAEIKKIRQQVLKDFKDAFIISFKDGKKVK
ncbi:N-acetylmuramoyl-L-alanine amidase [Parabacteroides sp. PF5-6]|uniref:N-acetylmuramoyl-L-alanine amidase family protein n=1 Tax=Parabacteroides sp. PF5-6 TaxID=1742403 RepID=UPI0024052087|nr:N-acetylmuramoyl-L-alanine amidase [Parabacteroides sp. PF5-6]MDF9830280.1 N-acetylmuramoyl-L-alanine amidase [Parabacteroides sp. PF5-6]